MRLEIGMSQPLWVLSKKVVCPILFPFLENGIFFVLWLSAHGLVVSVFFHHSIIRGRLLLGFQSTN